jgi:hypothetical protein
MPGQGGNNHAEGIARLPDDIVACHKGFQITALEATEDLSGVIPFQSFYIKLLAKVGNHNPGLFRAKTVFTDVTSGWHSFTRFAFFSAIGIFLLHFLDAPELTAVELFFPHAAMSVMRQEGE